MADWTLSNDGQDALSDLITAAKGVSYLIEGMMHGPDQIERESLEVLHDTLLNAAISMEAHLKVERVKDDGDED